MGGQPQQASSLASLGLTAAGGRNPRITGLTVDSRAVEPTSVSTFCRQIWELLNLSAVNLGTTGIEGAWRYPLAHTTPEPITLHRALAEAARNKVTHVAMEASSHGLDQRRLDGVMLAAAGFTNFTQDHLDYHKTFAAYFEAKMGLFTRVLSEDGVAVVNLDDPKGHEVASLCTVRGQEVIGVGRHPDAALQLTAQRFDSVGQDVLFKWQGGLTRWGRGTRF